MSIFVRRSGALFISMIFLYSAGEVLAQDTCEQAYLTAEEQYRGGEFGLAISTLAGCIERPGTLEPEREIPVYRLLALSYIRQGDLDEAQIAILELLSRHPEYEADPVADPPAYASLVTLVRQRFTAVQPPAGEAQPDTIPREPEEEPERRRSFLRSPVTWLSVGGGAILTTIILVATGGGGGGNGGPGGSGGSLPTPPNLP